jgi:hypothetical protein
MDALVQIMLSIFLLNSLSFTCRRKSTLSHRLTSTSRLMISPTEGCWFCSLYFIFSYRHTDSGSIGSQALDCNANLIVVYYYTAGRHKRQKEEDIAVCECQYNLMDPDSACGERCWNVSTNTECTPGYCPCGVYCKNQVSFFFFCCLGVAVLVRSLFFFVWLISLTLILDYLHGAASKKENSVCTYFQFTWILT